MNETRLHPDLDRLLRHVNAGRVRREPNTGTSRMQPLTGSAPGVDVTWLTDWAEMDGYIELAADGRYTLTRAGVQALISTGGRA